MTVISITLRFLKIQPFPTPHDVTPIKVNFPSTSATSGPPDSPRQTSLPLLPPQIIFLVNQCFKCGLFAHCAYGCIRIVFILTEPLGPKLFRLF